MAWKQIAPWAASSEAKRALEDQEQDGPATSLCLVTFSVQPYALIVPARTEVSFEQASTKKEDVREVPLLLNV